MSHQISYVQIEYGNSKFLISETPYNSNIGQYISILSNRKIKNVVRLCEPTYDNFFLNNNGITIHDLIYEDGKIPSSELIEQWLDLVNQSIALNEIIAVHCMSGLGRAPLLVAIALIDRGMAPIETIELIRKKRKNAFNSKHIDFILSYKIIKQSGCTCNLL